ncbi:phosphatidylserine decarboxylase [Marinovum sp. 2_MG-2023]|uniref:phosphatidylserine decarboxylase n=1 Tax=Roseobacteraceae TaxID=2854170 RepID=UPI0026E22ADE|nr:MULTISPECIES: phosphatidylserine decarboxylase [unclassified Marinovum]MDO6731552.1 phosphatidylserine decarboxylase [Marinovum sp. 2_MG-2023]MDO6780912.1 phosphatidylserine decarboxylase [Marinovum sp. 1_MG-2023]
MTRKRHKMRMRDTFIKPMHPEGRRFVAIFAAITVLLFLVSQILGWIGVGLTVWCYYFFRDPKRVVPVREGLVVSPADGIVSLIEHAVPPPELGMSDAPLLRVSVFMSVFNCHVNRAPVPGRITAIAYRAGKFFNASLDKASSDNERNSLCIEMADGRQIAVVQIAGLVARRIVCFVSEGDTIDAGARFGLIRFGSRLDVYLPDGVLPQVHLGQTMIAGETVLADLTANDSDRVARTD